MGFLKNIYKKLCNLRGHGEVRVERKGPFIGGAPYKNYKYCKSCGELLQVENIGEGIELNKEKEQALDELVQQSQELGLYED